MFSEVSKRDQWHEMDQSVFQKDIFNENVTEEYM